MDRSSHHSSGTRTPRNDRSSRRDRTSENRPTPYDTRKTSHQSSHIMNNAGGYSIQFNGTANVRTLNMTGPEPASLPPANRVVDSPAHAARPPSSGTRHSSAQISNDDGGGVTGERISGSPRAGNNPQQRDAGLNGEQTHAAGPNIAPATAPAPAPAPAPAQPPGFGNVSLTHAEAGYHQQPQGGHTVEQTRAPGPNIGFAPFLHASDVDIDHYLQYGEFASSAQMNAVTHRPDGVQTHAVPGSSTAGYLQPTTTAPPSTVAQQHSSQLWDNFLSQDSEKRF